MQADPVSGKRLDGIKRDIRILRCAIRNPGTPWTVKLIIFLAVAYLLNPVDLIPDFIPVIGLLDDVILVPMLVGLAIRLIPEELRKELAKPDISLADQPE